MNPVRPQTYATQLVFGYRTRHRADTASSTPIEATVVFFVVLVALLAAWVAGVVQLFQKGRRILGFISLAGIVIPIVMIVGYVGWFVKPVDR